MFINHAAKQVTAKIVYYGPGLSGKTSNLQYIFSVTNPKSRGELVSIETDIERTLFFDLLPLNVGLIKGYQAKFQLYTVPGQIFYDATRKLVLKGADGIVFVADSQELMSQANEQSLENLKVNLAANGKKFEEMPIVFQYNKRDLGGIMPIPDLNRELNPNNASHFEAVAKTGTGVIETLRDISGKTLALIKESIDSRKGTTLAGDVAVQFDTNREKEIIKKESLPVRSVSMDNLESFKQEPLSEPLPVENSTPSAVPPSTQKPAASASDRPGAATLQSIREMAAQFLGGEEDKSRITLIQKLPVSSSKISVDIRNGNSGVLQTIELPIQPETRKVTLVFDLKR